METFEKLHIKVVADRNIPYIAGILEKYVDEVVFLSGSSITAEDVRDADALFVRTRTKCGKALLEGSRVRFIASATIGEDHIDRNYCESAGISVYIAKGCNSGGVMQYVYTVLSHFALDSGYDFRGKTIGVVGVGNVGSKVSAVAERLGMHVLRCDPPVARALASEGRDSSAYIPLDDLLGMSDIVTLHVPLDSSTRAMASSGFFGLMRPGAVFFNTSRGEVVDEKALLSHRDRLSLVALDVWNGEPHISADTLSAADVATPHIAGYSLQGKINGSNMVLNAFGKFFSVPDLQKLDLYTLVENSSRVSMQINGLSEGGKWEDDGFLLFCKDSLDLFPVMELDSALRSDPLSFERLRADYKYRSEATYI